MANQPDIQYVRFYTDGSAARVLEPAPKKKKVPLPKPRKRRPERLVIRLDPVSLLAMAVAGFMLVTMAIGMIRLGIAKSEAAEMEAYAAQLRAENAQLQEEFESGFDLEEIERKALAMGLVPKDQVEHITIQVQPPEAEEAPTAWETFCAFVKELFA